MPDSGFALAYDNRGNAWRVRKNYDMAIADYKEAIRLVPGNPGPYNALAWIWATSPRENCGDGKTGCRVCYPCRATASKWGFFIR